VLGGALNSTQTQKTQKLATEIRYRVRDIGGVSESVQF